MSDKEHAREPLERLEPGQFAVLVHVMELLTYNEDREELTDEDCRIILESRGAFRQGGRELTVDRFLPILGSRRSDSTGIDPALRRLVFVGLPQPSNCPSSSTLFRRREVRIRE
jgi:hypothetical protein